MVCRLIAWPHSYINDCGYEAELHHKGITQILKMGLAFHEKEVAMVSER